VRLFPSGLPIGGHVSSLPNEGERQMAEQQMTATALQKNVTVAVFRNHAEAEGAVKQLQQAGFDMKNLSIVGKDYEMREDVVGYYTTGDRIARWGAVGAFWGGIWGLLLGAAFFIVPGVGPVLVGGPLVAAIVGALESAVVTGGLSAIGAGLYGLGIPKNSVLAYEGAIQAGKYVLIAHGTEEEATQARELLATADAELTSQHVA
jgi:hypothetical protein